ncbi:hypothetical protein [Kaistia defluvii]|uniref:DUF2188 domain-containing protein n=1 Tax=Kaistia defluvii TaxID=410841 RepID=A0ABV2R102_9HYPH
MEKLTIALAPKGEGWIVEHRDANDVIYLTKEAALQGAIAVIETAMAEGLEIHLNIPGGSGRFD